MKDFGAGLTLLQDQFMMSTSSLMISHSQAFKNYQHLVTSQRLLFKWRIVVNRGNNKTLGIWAAIIQLKFSSIS